MSRMTDILYISDGDDDDDGEIAFIGSSNLTRKRIPVPIIVDDDDSDTDDRASSPDSSGGQLPDIMDLFKSDPASELDLATATTIVHRMDRKGKGRAVDLRTLPTVSTRRTSIARISSPVFDGIEDVPTTTAPRGGGKKVGKRKSDQMELEGGNDSASVSPVKLSKEAKEASKAEEKKRKQLEKAQAKADKEAEKSFHRKLADANRLRTSKNDTLREVHLYLSADLQSPSSPIAGALPEILARVTESHSELHYLPEDDSLIPGVVRFKRHVKSRYDHDRKAWIPLDDEKWEWEGTILVIVTAEEVTDMIANDGMYDWVGDVRLALGMKARDQLMIMVKGLNKHYSKLKSQQNKAYTAAARAGLAGKEAAGQGAGNGKSKKNTMSHVGRSEIETALVKAQMETKCFFVHVERTEDIEDWIYNLAGDIAIRPYKLLSKAHLSFCATDGIKKASTAGDVFELMLQEVQGITPSAAAGIRAEYESFQILMEAYERLERRGGHARAEVLLEDCQIKNLRSGVASGRRLNKALSKRVYNVFRGQDSLALV